MKVIVYGGYYSSGGSVIRDVLREHEPNINFPNEFRLIKEPHGLLDLFRAITIDRSPERIDYAIMKFLWLANNFARTYRPLGKLGFSYQKYFKGKFLQSTKLFIDALTDYQYPFDWHLIQFDKPWLLQLPYLVWGVVPRKYRKARVPRRLGRMVNKNDEEVLIIFKNYLRALFNVYCEGYSHDVIGLHNSMSFLSYGEFVSSKLLLGNVKALITDRDPRDIYVNYSLDSYGRYIPVGKAQQDRVADFIAFYKRIRMDKELFKTDEDVKILQFEELCFSEDMLANVLSEAGLSFLNHVKPGTYFSPSRSRHNVGLWKGLPSTQATAISEIEQALPSYLWEG